MTVDKRYKTKETDLLVRSLLSLKNEQEVYSFLIDLLTVAEIKSLSQRIVVAKLLDEGAHYNDIAGKTGASTATISRVKRFLDYGEDGYKTVLNRIK